MQKEQIQKQLKENIGREVHVWLLGDPVHYYGKIISFDGTRGELLDHRSGQRKPLSISNIKSVSLGKNQYSSPRVIPKVAEVLGIAPLGDNYSNIKAEAIK